MLPATNTLLALRGGVFNDDLGEALNKASAAVRETGRKAKVIVEITINPFDGEAGEVERVALQDKITLKLPEKKKRDSVFFLNSENDLLRQQEIPGVQTPKSATDAQKAS